MQGPTRARRGHRRWSLRIATIDGIDVRVHASMLLLVWLVIVVSIDEPEGQAAPLLWLMLLFGSVLVHELAHSLVARRVGVQVKEIELLPIGGVSKMDRIPDRPRDEIAIAVAGPLTSLSIGFGALAVAAMFRADLWPPDLYGGAVVQRIGWLNLLLAGFNLIPALPLDGGRVLRAVAERRVGPTRATQIAARAGHHFAVAMIVIGVLVNLWLIVIGVFILLSSNAEAAGAVVHEELGHLVAADVMLHRPITVPPAMTFGELTAMLRSTAQRQFPVVDGDRYIGMVDADEIAPFNVRVDALTEPVEAIGPRAPLDEVAAIDARTIVAVPVVEGGIVVGLVSLRDVGRVAQRALQKERL
jgi:Zn-dependent protease